MRAKALRALPAALTAFAPVVAVIVLVWLYFGRSLQSFTPIWSDEVDYWREIGTFSHVGFGGGYYTIDESVPAAGFSHFGTHGPVFPVMFGTPAAVLGWHAASGPFFNVVCLVAAVLAYFALVRPDRWQFLLATGSILVFWPILLYLPTSMQETPHQALAILLAGVFAVLIRDRDRTARWIFVVGVVALTIASLLRPTWAPLFVPLFLFRMANTTWRNAARASLMAAPIVAVAFLLGMWLSAPYPSWVAQLLETTKASKRAGAHMFLDHLGTNASLLFQGFTLERGMRFQMLAILVLAVGFIVYPIVRKRRRAGEQATADTLNLAHLLNIGPVLVISVALYDIAYWRDFRVFAPHVLLAIMASVPFVRPTFARRTLALVLVPLAVNALLIISFVPTFREFHEVHFAAGPGTRTVLADAVTYRPDADPWTNTVLVDQANNTADLLQLPPGIGVSVISVPDRVASGIKSRYLLVTDSTLAELGNPPGWRFLGATTTGRLFVRDAAASTALKR